METSGVVPAGAVTSPELVALGSSEGPFLSVYLTTEAEVENAPQRSTQRWKVLRNVLSGRGAPEAALDLVDPLVREAHLEGKTLAVIATADRVLHVEHHHEAPAGDVGCWRALPVLSPIIEWRQQAIPYVVVLTDRRGAELVAYRHAGGEADVETVDRGSDEPIRKVAPGGWSQRRYQQRAENTWEENAVDVSKELVRVVEDIGARLVLVAGDVRAVQLLREHLPREVDELVTLIDGGGRANDGSEGFMEDDARTYVATLVATDTRVMLEKFREESGQGDRAADGPTPTVTAINEARAAVLLVPSVLDDADADVSTGHFGPAPIPIARSDDELRVLGVESRWEAPLVDVLIRGALGTGAGVRVIPSAAAPKQGIGAILRW